jgi:DNA-binding MarR family transcriptional regulator
MSGGSIDDEKAYALAMLIVDATLDGDEASLHTASRQLQIVYRALVRTSPDPEDRAEDRGRVLALLDVASWGMERALSWSALAELEFDSSAHQFLKAVSEQPGMTNHALAQEIGISEAEASRVGRRLADVSLAAKRRLGRRNHWEVTPKGIQTLELLENGGASRYLRPHYQIQ